MGNNHFVEFFFLRRDVFGITWKDRRTMTKCQFLCIWKACDATFITQSLCTIVLSIDILLAAYTSKFIETVKVLVLCLMICGICCASHVIGFVTWAGCLLEMAWSNLLTISGVIDSICKNACHTTWSNFMLVVNRMISSKRWYGKYWCDASRSTANISTIDCDHKYWKWSVFILTLSPSISYVSFSSAIKSKLRQTVKKGLQTQTQQQKHRDQLENVWRKLHSLCLPIHGTRAQEHKRPQPNTIKAKCQLSE